MGYGLEFLAREQADGYLFTPIAEGTVTQQKCGTSLG